MTSWVSSDNFFRFENIQRSFSNEKKIKNGVAFPNKISILFIFKDKVPLAPSLKSYSCHHITSVHTNLQKLSFKIIYTYIKITFILIFLYLHYLE